MHTFLNGFYFGDDPCYLDYYHGSLLDGNARPRVAPPALKNLNSPTTTFAFTSQADAASSDASLDGVGANKNTASSKRRLSS